MKTLTAIVCGLGLALIAHAQNQQPPAEAPPPEQAAPMPEAPPAQAEQPAVAEPQPSATTTTAVPVSTEAAAEPEEKPVAKVATQEMPDSFTPPAKTVDGDKELHLNFRGAPIEMVLSYLSDAAGFIIELNTPVHGKVDVWSAQPVSKEEAVDILNSVLNKNGYAAIRNGRRLTIVSKSDALHADIPVRLGNDPASVPKNDEIVTQIIPIRFVEAQQLVRDLSPLLSPQATIIANEAANSIAVTDTQANIRHLLEVIKAIDSSAEDSTELRVFHLDHADPTEMANLLNGLFNTQGSSTAQTPVQFGRGVFGGFGGFGGGGNFGGGGGNRGGGAGNASNNSQSQRIKKRQQVVAVADARTSSVVVTATKDLIDQIGDMIQELDYHSPKESSVQVFHLNNADPQQVLPVLQDMFQSSTSTRNNRTGSSQNSMLMNRIQQYQNSNTGSLGTGTGNSGGGRGGSSAPQF
jgi:type II secretory pathway component GspD/PulD (secretin)